MDIRYILTYAAIALSSVLYGEGTVISLNQTITSDFDCPDPYIAGIDSCFNAGPSHYSATKSDIDLTDFNNIRFEWNQCTDGGLFNIYIAHNMISLKCNHDK